MNRLTCRAPLRLLLITLSITVLGMAVATLARADGEQGAEPPAQYSSGGKLCLACHNEGRIKPAHEILLTRMGTTTDPASPFGEGNHDCEACHGPSKAHTRGKRDQRPKPSVTFGPETPANEKNAPCLSCHDDGERLHWAGSTHDIQEVACVDCHTLHAENDPVLALETQPAVCYACHAEQRALFLRQSRHPVQSATGATSGVGLMACTDCHNPHGSAGEALLVRDTLNETCYECHAEKRGPFLWEHQPVREDCSNCHEAHGSNYAPLLKGRAPWICQQCHNAWDHPSMAYSGTGIPPQGASPQVLAGQCLNCHSQVHGSNHPSGVRWTR